MILWFFYFSFYFYSFCPQEFLHKSNYCHMVYTWHYAVILNIVLDEIVHMPYNHYMIQGIEYVHKNHKSISFLFYYESHPHPLTLGHKKFFSLIIHLFCFFYIFIKMEWCILSCFFTKSMFISFILLYFIINLWCCLISMPFLIPKFVFSHYLLLNISDFPV